MIKILIIGPLPKPINGCSLANQTLYKNLQKRGYDVSAINTAKEKNISSKQGERFSLSKAIAFLETYSKLNYIVKTDLVYLTPGQTFFGLLKYSPFIILCWLFFKPYVIHIHGNYIGRSFQEMKGLRKRLFSSLIKKAKAGIVLSDSLKNNFNNLLPSYRVFVAENFANDELYKIDIESKSFDMLRIVYLSNLMPEKGILDLLKALIILKQQNIRFKCKLAGYIEDDIYEEVYTYLKKLSGLVTYEGIVDGEAKIKLLAEANTFVLPTYYKMEGQPISVLEAMASGNIIVTTRHAGIPDVVDSLNNIYVEKKKPASIADALIVISKSVGEMKGRAINNKKYAIENFTEDAFSEKIITALKFSTERTSATV